MIDLKKEIRYNKIEKLEFLCNLTLSKNINYTDKAIYTVIDYCLEAFKIANNEITLNKDERLKVFIKVKEYNLNNI